MEGKIVYFENIGRENTEEVLRIAKRRAQELGIKTILVASTIGDTGAMASEALTGLKVIVVSHATGFGEANVQRLTAENRQRIESNGGTILTRTHIFAGVDRAMRKKFNMSLLADIIINTLFIFGRGMKVACEIGMMAADAGLVRTDEDVISIAGSGRGADTAVVLKPVNSTDFFDLKVKEILCKPLFTTVPQRQEVAVGAQPQRQ